MAVKSAEITSEQSLLASGAQLDLLTVGIHLRATRRPDLDRSGAVAKTILAEVMERLAHCCALSLFLPSKVRIPCQR